MNCSPGRFPRGLLAPMAVAVALRLGLMVAAYWLTGTSVMTQGDTQSYVTPGLNLLAHGSFATDGLPEIDRTPGYPLFAALAGMWAQNVLLVVMAQILVSVLSLWLVCRIAGRMFPGTDAGRFAAWMFAVEPLSLLYAVRLMPETLFVLLMLAAVERLIAFQLTGRLGAVAVAGLMLAAATYVRPVSYYLAVPLALGLMFTGTGSARLRWVGWKAPLLLLGIVAPLVGVWHARNYIETGYRGFSSIVEINLYYYQAAAITAELEHRTLEEEQRRLGYPDQASYVTVHPEQRFWSQARQFAYMRGEALAVLKAHRGLYLRSHLAGVGVVAFTPCASEWLQMLGVYPDEQSMPHRILNEGVGHSIARVAEEHPGVMALMAVLEGALLVLYLLAIRGCFVAGAYGPAMLLLLGISLYFLLIAGGAQAVGRYRIPVMPELCILAAGGVLGLQRKKRAGID